MYAQFNIGDKVKDIDLYKAYPGTIGIVTKINPVIVRYWDISVKYSTVKELNNLKKA